LRLITSLFPISEVRLQQSCIIILAEKSSWVAIAHEAQRIVPSGRTWNDILIEAKQREIEQQKQRSRGFSR
jgi:hypothetical protein